MEHVEQRTELKVQSCPVFVIRLKHVEGQEEATFLKEP